MSEFTSFDLALKSLPDPVAQQHLEEFKDYLKKETDFEYKDRTITCDLERIGKKSKVKTYKITNV